VDSLRFAERIDRCAHLGNGGVQSPATTVVFRAHSVRLSKERIDQRSHHDRIPRRH
jgi:hypothetical protein